MAEPFRSKSEVEEYISHDKIECLECGKLFSFLVNHVRRAHSMTLDEYRGKFNIPAGTPLAGLLYREKHREKLKRLVDDGALDYSHLSSASDKSKQAGRGERRDFDLQEQAELIKRNADYPARTLPPGARRADGSDADRCREYQRAYRALKKGDFTLMREYRIKYR